MAARVAIVGSGIAGLSAAHHLHGYADISLFEAGDYFGGHTHTVDITLPGANGPVNFGVDTGFLVYNERTYPGLIDLFHQLGIETAHSDMSFSVQAPWGQSGCTLEWNGADLNSVFAQRSNLLRPKFWWLLREIIRFNTLCTRLAQSYDDGALMQPLQDFLDNRGFGATFRDTYLLPMLGCIWSCPTTQMLQFPVATMIRFCHNHGLIQISNRPQWHTVAGGARHYVDKITAGIADKRLNCPVQQIARDADGVRVTSQGQTERFDKVVIATHSDQALALLGDPSDQECTTLGAIAYQSNVAVLHTDAAVLPQRRRAWAAWNYERSPTWDGQGGDVGQRVCLHYLINRLQPIPFAQPVVVSLNPLHDIAPQHVLDSFEYAHPVFDLTAIRAQADVPALQGQSHTYFCGAWTGYGFHEDGLKSGLDVAARLREAMGS